MRASINKILSVVNKYITVICMLLVSSLVFVLFIQVIFRFIFSNALTWPDELARFLLIWLTFLGASIATWYKGHLGIEFFISYFSKKLQKVIVLYVVYTSIILFLAIALISSINAISFSFGMHLVSLPLTWGHAFISFPIGIGLCLIYYLNFIFNKRVD